LETGVAFIYWMIAGNVPIGPGIDLPPVGHLIGREAVYPTAVGVKQGLSLVIADLAHSPSQRIGYGKIGLGGRVAVKLEERAAVCGVGVAIATAIISQDPCLIVFELGAQHGCQQAKK
jgi:hypothetical protein